MANRELEVERLKHMFETGLEGLKELEVFSDSFTKKTKGGANRQYSGLWKNMSGSKRWAAAAASQTPGQATPDEGHEATLINFSNPGPEPAVVGPQAGNTSTFDMIDLGSGSELGCPPSRPHGRPGNTAVGKEPVLTPAKPPPVPREMRIREGAMGMRIKGCAGKVRKPLKSVPVAINRAVKLRDAVARLTRSTGTAEKTSRSASGYFRRVDYLGLATGSAEEEWKGQIQVAHAHAKGPDIKKMTPPTASPRG